MLFKRVESKGLAHYSYLIGHNKEAVVIDPRRDVDIYLTEASRRGYHVKYILETHRNEDYVIGSKELSERTGAEIWHADSQLDYRYGNSVEDGQVWKVGGLKIKAIHTPGHTPGSMSYLLFDNDGNPWIIFTGDLLFAGDVGRIDLVGRERIPELAELMYDSIFRKILPLGDGIIISPAHGAGSVCGGEIAERLWTTIGLERELNPRLKHTDKDVFIRDVSRELERPPYFRMMEKLNIEGAEVFGCIPVPEPMSPDKFEKEMMNAFILDSRMELGFGAAHIPGSLSIWSDGIPNFAGWFVPYDKPILLVNETDDPVKEVRYLMRMGYDNIKGFLSGGMLSWHMKGKESSSIETITVQELCHHLDEKKGSWILDVRSPEEIDIKGEIPLAHKIHLTQISSKIDDIPDDRTVFIFCGSGLRSMIAASFLRMKGFSKLVVILGGLSGWNSSTCPVKY